MSTQQDTIEVDPSLADTSSSYESDYDTSTQSLTSSINEYVYENGRRYHVYYGHDKNPLPTDEIEQDRMDLQHELLLCVLDGALYKAPISESPGKILDIGTGTGIWAIDMAGKFPMAEVVGTDLSPIQSNWVPPNCRFEVDDAELAWMYPENHWDFVHARNVGQAISNWPKVMNEIFKATKPGGFCELAEIGGVPMTDDDSMGPTHPTNLWFVKMREGMVKLGRPATMNSTILRHNLESAGFVDVVTATFKIPLAPWARDKKLKHVGMMNLLNGETGYAAYGLALFTRLLGMGHDQAEKLCRDALEAAQRRNSHIYQLYHVAYGYKPE